MHHRSLQTPLRILLLAFVYFVTGWLGLMLPAVDSHITLIWLPTGIAVAALLRWGFGCWPGVALGSVAVNLACGVELPTALGIAVGNTAGPLLAAWFLRKTGFHLALDRQRDILLLGAAAMLGMLISSANGVAMLTLGGCLPDHRLAAWLAWWAGDAMGVIAATPLLVSFTRQEWRSIVLRRVEFVSWIGATGLVVFGVFVWNTDRHGEVWALAFLTLPLVAWAALRFGAVGTSLAIILLSAGAAYATATGRGPLHRTVPAESVVVLWLFMTTSAVLGWLITAVHSARLKATTFQHLFEQALTDVSLGVLLSDLDWKITYANAGFTRLTGYTEAEMLGKSCRILHGPETDPATAEKIRTALQGDGYFDGEILNYRKDGTCFWNGLVISPVHDEHGVQTGFLGIQRSITKRREAEKARQDSEVRVRKLIENAPEAIVLQDVAGGRFLNVNPAAERLFKLPAAELRKVGPVQLSPPLQPDGRRSSEMADEYIARAVAGETPVFEWIHRDSEGRDIPCEVRLLRIEINGQAVIRGSITDISARREVETALKDSIAFTENLIRFMQEGFSVLDANGVQGDVNPAFCKMTGFSAEELKGSKPPHPYWPPEDLARIEAAFNETLKGNFSVFELTFMRKNGERFPVLFSPSGIQDKEGKFITYMATVRDITLRRRAEDALRRSEERLRLTLAASSAGTWSWEVSGNRADWDDRYHEMYGFAPDAPRTFETWMAGIHPEDRARLQGQITTLIESTSDNDWAEEFRALHPTKGERWMSGRGKVERDTTGRAIGMNGINLDVTERKRAEEALRESEERLRFALTSADTGMWDWDVAGGRGRVTSENQRIFGLPETLLDPTREDYDRLFHPDDAERVARAFLTAAEGGETFDAEYRIRRANDGAERWVHSIGKLLTMPNGRQHFMGISHDVTQRKQAEGELQRNQSQLQAILDYSPALISIKDLQGNIVVANRGFEVLDAPPPGELVGKNVFDVFPAEVARQLWDNDLAALHAGTHVYSEEKVRHKDGKWHTYFTVKFPICLKPGEPVGICAISNDITQRKQAEEALLLANQKLKLHFEQTPMAVIEWDLSFRVTRWNPAAQTIFGFSHAEAVGQHASFIVPERYRGHVDELWRALMKKSGGDRSSNENVRKDGRMILCDWYNTPLIDERGTVTGVASVVMDITERRQAQQLLAWEKNALELISSAASLHDVLEGLMYGLEKQAPGALCSVLLLDDDGIHLRHGAAPSLPEAYNRAVDGVAIGPAVGSCGTAVHFNRQVIVPDIARDPLWADYRELALGHGLRACWSTPIHGSKRKILGSFAIYYREPRQPIPSEVELIGRVTHIIRVAIERKQAEEALRESEEKFRTLFENAGDAIILTQGDCFAECNPRTLEMFGCASRGQIVGHPPYEFSPPRQPDGRDSRESAVEKINAALAGQRQFFEWMHTKHDGTPFPAEVTLNPVTLKGRTILQAIVRDISERKAAEEAIRMLNADLERRVKERTAELLAANKELEAFSYSVSHDLRAPLRAVDGFSRMVVKNYADRLDDEGRRLLEVIRAGAQRMGRLIDDLLAFSRLGRQALAPLPIDMHALAQSVFDELAAHETGRKLRLDLHPLPAARGTPSMVRQVWVNLISNAIKFTKDREVGEIAIGAQAGGDGGTVYYVKDNGAGFDMRYADKLFGVFQRLHAMDEFEGTGVGLALVQRIVQRHGGRVWAEAEVNRGATFFFTLADPRP